MAKTKIEWCDYTINSVKGLCPVGCSYCYARRMYKRFKWNPEVRFDPDVLLQTRQSKNPNDKFFWGSTMELFGEWVQDEWLQSIFDYIRCENWGTHIFLTKRPENLIKWTFPENCWVGVSVTGKESPGFAYPLAHLKAKIKFLSIEPILNHVDLHPESLQGAGIQWLIIGQMTPVKASTRPKIEWIKEIVDAADELNVPVFLKNNLAKGVIDTSMDWAFNKTGYRQEYPVVKKSEVKLPAFGD